MAALLLIAYARGPAAQAPLGLFGDDVALDLPALSDTGGPEVLRHRAARVHVDRLAAPADASPDAAVPLTLNLFDDVVLTAERERIEADMFGHQTWIGRVDDDPLSHVSVTWKGDVLSGTISTSTGLYRLSSSNGTAVIEELDASSFPVELPPLVPPAADRVPAPSPGLARPAAGEVVDIFVYYTTAAKDGAGGQANIEATIAQAVATSNTAYARSGVAATKRLVGTAELAGFVQHASDMTQDLVAFRTSATVSAMRESAGADLMHLILGNTTSNVCGVGYLGPSASFAHAVTARSCISGYTFTHEVGHNMGSHHAPEDGASGAWRAYAYGYKMCSGGSPFRSIMAYACPGGGGTRILNLSNPGVLHNGQTTGTAGQNNALSHSEAFPIVQAFRTPVAGTLPTAPLNLQASVVGNTITVSWQPPAQGTPLSTYIVRAGSGPGLSNVYNGPVGNVTTVTSPIANGTYYIRVLAQNATGMGPATADVIATVGAPPGPPQNVVATASGGTIVLNWSPPAGGGAVSTYVVQAGTSSGTSNLFNGAVGAGTSASGAVGPGTYYLRVLAHGPGGTSPPSNEATVTVGPSCTVPVAPSLTGSRSGNVLTINWTTPAGGPVSGYMVRAGSASMSSNLYNAPVGLTNSASAAVGPGSYYIRVLANAACGSSAESNEVVVTVP